MEKDGFKSSLTRKSDITIDDFPKSFGVRVLECDSKGYVFINERHPEIIERNTLYFGGLRNLYRKLIQGRLS